MMIIDTINTMYNSETTQQDLPKYNQLITKEDGINEYISSSEHIKIQTDDKLMLDCIFSGKLASNKIYPLLWDNQENVRAICNIEKYINDDSG
jgi:hypothetical protein